MQRVFWILGIPRTPAVLNIPPTRKSPTKWGCLLVSGSLFHCVACGMSVDDLALRVAGEKPNVSKFLCPRCHGWAKSRRRSTRLCDTCGEPCHGKRCQPCRRATWACAQCGADTGRHGRKFCSPECQQAARPRHRQFTCVQCGQSFAPSRGKAKGSKGEQRFCSRDCAADSQRRLKPHKYPASRVYFPTCVECGRTFCAKSASAKRCSERCRLDAVGARVKDLYALSTQFDKESGAYLGGAWRKALIQYLVDRDGDKCGICNRKVDITLKSGTKGSRLGPSVDHIIPRSQGGEDELANYRLTHWGCNQARGNRGGFEQLALVG